MAPKKRGMAPKKHGTKRKSSDEDPKKLCHALAPGKRTSSDELSHGAELIRYLIQKFWCNKLTPEQIEKFVAILREFKPDIAPLDTRAVEVIGTLRHNPIDEEDMEDMIYPGALQMMLDGTHKEHPLGDTIPGMCKEWVATNMPTKRE